MYDEETHRFIDKDFGRTLWSTYPVACSQCERNCIRSAQNTSEMRTEIDKLMNGMVKKGLWLDRVARKQTMRVARDFFRAAFLNRLKAGAYKRDLDIKVMAWRRLLDEQGALLLASNIEPKPPRREGFDLSLEILRTEVAGMKQEIFKDTLKLVTCFLGQRWGAQGHFNTGTMECTTLSNHIGNLRDKYEIRPGDLVDYINDDPVWGLDDQDPEDWH